MKREYDIVYLTNTPSFYKLNLCESIAQNGVKLLIVLYGYGSEAVNKQLNEFEHSDYDFVFINHGDSHTRNRLTTFLRLLRLMSSIRVHKVIFSGWFSLEYNLYAFLSKKHKNAMVCESSILDVSMDGIKGWLKRRIINRMKYVLPSGKQHKLLFDSIGYNGKSFITGSVGIFNKKNKRHLESCERPLRYIYVGRLIEEKNVRLLIEAFNKNGLPLSIVGSGILESELKVIANSNINFWGFIDNEVLGEVYRNHNIFILPSKYEPWGLVVEEALFRGLPVIASDKVGAAEDMVNDLHTGVIFKSDDIGDLQNAIDKLSANYETYLNAVNAIDWTERDRNQINAYLKILSE